MEEQDADYRSSKTLAAKSAAKLNAGFQAMSEKEVRQAIGIFEIKSLAAEKLMNFYCSELNKAYAQRHDLQWQLLAEKKKTARAEEKYALAIAMATGAPLE